eukprot:23046_1
MGNEPTSDNYAVDEDPRYRCPKDHPLEPFQPERIGHTCVKCKDSIHPLTDKAIGCRICNFDLCFSCFLTNQFGIDESLMSLLSQTNNQQSRPIVTNRHSKEVSYHDRSKGVFGCVHYARNCWIKHKCCDTWYVCRFCHDRINHHQIDRYSIQFVKCMRCGTEQKSSKYCIKCAMESDNSQEMKGNASTEEKYCFARYYCNICNLYDDAKDKEIFHCQRCRECVWGDMTDHACVDTSDATQLSPQKYNGDVVQELVNLHLGSREQCIKASSMVCDFNNINDVREMLQTMDERHERYYEQNDMNASPAPQPIVPASDHPSHELKYDDPQETQTPTIDSSKYSMITESAQFISLKQVMTRYENGTNMDDIDIQSTYNDFLYLENNYGNDDQFEFIYNQLGKCSNTNQCPIFVRNYRDRSRIPLRNANTINARTQILDKIHCFYKHSFDMGYRLTDAQRERVSRIVNAEIDENAPIYVNKQILKKYQLISGHSVPVSHSIPNKFNSYAHGQSFSYDKTPALKSILSAIGKRKPLVLYEADATYKSLKDEITNNTSQHLTMAQWDEEYKKCTTHRNSPKCKKKCPTITVDMMLSLQIYCNYDQLQYEFSKTYRDNINDHYNWYHLGKNLTTAIHRCGKPCGLGRMGFGAFNSNLTHRDQTGMYYHGIGEKLLFDERFDGQRRYIQVLAPLSTTTSFTVAMNVFTNQNSGLVVSLFTPLLSHHFSVWWVSKFSNEKEHLFIQEGFGFYIANITDPGLGHEYTCLLSALQHFDLTFAKCENEKLIYIMFDEESRTISDGMKSVIETIVESRLSNEPTILSD